MKNILRSLAFGATLLSMLAVSESTFAQQIRSRSLAPAFDFSNMQMPVEILSIKLNGKEVQPGEKIDGDDDWLLGLSFTFKNISDKPIAFIDIGLRFPSRKGLSSIASTTAWISRAASLEENLRRLLFSRARLST